ncbi:MAG TPA: glycerol-3-phosphate 1-O-acyltransferase PlsY [Gemmatimonadaceae bacterium]|nr:glycerol-3-phosphate 1-O-acyltransferase PlsY [Gemmatimonadaceae bacterium]
MPAIVGILISYLFGSIPTAYLAGKARGVDLRAHGSGNLGATNVARVLGTKVGILVFVADVLKGFLPVWILPRYIESTNLELWAVLFGAAAILGHVRPIFLGGKGGGKGVATASGVFLALSFIPLLIAQAVWAMVFYVTRYVSLASLISAAILPIAILTWWRDPASPVFLASVLVAVFVFWTHRTNIGRLRRGEEHRFVKKADV